MARTTGARGPESVDLIIVGGGLAGLPLALAAAGAGLKTVVIDRADPKSQQDDRFDGRVTAIAHASHQIFRAIGIWHKMAADASPIQDIRVADGGAPFFLHFHHHDVGEAPFGYMLENRVLRRALAEAVAEASGPRLRLLAPVDVTAAERGPAAVTVAVSSGESFAAPLLVAADGKASSLRDQAGITSHTLDYRQTAIVLAMRHAKPHHGVAVEHFQPAGPFAVLPMTDGADGTHRSSIVWCEAPAVAKDIVGLDEAAFAAELRRKVGDWLGEVTPIGPRWHYPLSLTHAHAYHGHRLALIGDAAHAMHPIAGQGLNLGLRDVAVLAALIADARRLGMDIGAADLLRRYEAERRPDSLRLLLVTDGLTRLFSNDIAPLRIARGLGLGLVNRVWPLKRFFMRAAMGVGEVDPAGPWRMTVGVKA